MDLANLSLSLMNNLHLMWAFLLLVARFSGMMMVLPGIGSGERGYAVRYPAVLLLAFSALRPEFALGLPGNWIVMAVQIISEFALGLAIGLIPFMVVAGLQMGGMLSSSTMGLGAGNLIDPTLGVQASDLSRVFSDLSVIAFLYLGGHRVAIEALAGTGTSFVPGSFIASDISLEMLLHCSAQIFRIGIMVSSPVIVALLLTQFVMGLVTKAVPTVNVFVVSFPITVGIGLILSMLSLPEVLRYMEQEFHVMDTNIVQLVDDLQ